LREGEREREREEKLLVENSVKILSLYSTE
jgi:hypothetical protein